MEEIYSSKGPCNEWPNWATGATDLELGSTTPTKQVFQSSSGAWDVLPNLHVWKDHRFSHLYKAEFDIIRVCGEI
jgi:hypothetical protein